MKAKKVQIGDVVEIPTKLGKAYAQFSHYHDDPPRFGALLRVLPGIFQQPPENLANLIAGKEMFFTFFPLQAAVNRGIVRVVARQAVPLRARKFPTFRGGNVNPATGKVEQWWLWDGKKSWKIDRLSDKQLDLSIQGVWNDTLLIQRIEQGWTPRNAEYFTAIARAKKHTSENKVVSEILHFINVEARDDASVAVARIGELDMDCDIQRGDGIWTVVAHQKDLSPEERERIREYLFGVATALRGEYDGWEFRLQSQDDQRKDLETK